MPHALCVMSLIAALLKLWLLMSSDDFIHISPKQTPVINRLHDVMTQALAYADAIRDNAQDEGIVIPPELVASFAADYDRILTALTDAANNLSR